MLTDTGLGTVAIMAATGKSKTCIWRWHERFMAEGADGLLRDKTRPPGIATLKTTLVDKVVALTLEPPDHEATHWTVRAMAKAGRAFDDLTDGISQGMEALETAAFADRLDEWVIPELLVWVSSSSVAGGVPPLLGPYSAAKAGMDALAICYATELAPLGIETLIIVLGAFTSGTDHFANAGHPADDAIAAAYADAWPDSFADSMQMVLDGTVPEDADPNAGGRAVVDVVAAPQGKRPLRVHVDPTSDGAAVTFAVMDRVREQFLDGIGFPELMRLAKPDHAPSP